MRLLWFRRIALAVLGRYGARLRYPQLFVIAGACFALDFVLPDGLPFLDEIFFGLATLFFGLWRNRRSEEPTRNASEGARPADRRRLS